MPGFFQSIDLSHASLADGGKLLINQTSSGSALTLHTAHATNKDFITLWAFNVDASNERTLTLEIDGTSQPLKVKFAKSTANAADGAICILINKKLSGSKTIKAFADDASSIVVFGDAVRES